MNDMKHLFLPYELAVIAKEKGFDEPCFAYYNGYVNNRFDTTKPSAPLYQQIIDWFREKHGAVIYVSCHFDNFQWNIANIAEPHRLVDINKIYTNYYEALTKAIEETFKLIKTTP